MSESETHGAEKTAGAGVSVKIQLSHNAIAPAISGTVWALVSLCAAQARSKRLPLNLGLVLDRSGSMSGAPLSYVKSASQFVIKRLGNEDLLSLVVFDDQVSVPIKAQHPIDKDALSNTISQICTGGSTNLSGGLLRGYQEVSQQARSGLVSRLILLTDGQANVGITEPSLLAAKARKMATSGVPVSTMGVGLSFNEDLLSAVADAGRGNYYYIKNPDEIPSVFAQELEGLLSVVAQAVRVSVEGKSGAEVRSVLGYKPDFTLSGASVDLPDMFASETKTLLFEVAHPAFSAGEHELLSLKIWYTDTAGSLDAVTLDASVRLHAVDGPATLYVPNIEVIKTVELTRAAIAKDQAAQAMEDGDIAGSQKLLMASSQALRHMAQILPTTDTEVDNEIEQMDELIQRLCRDGSTGDPLGPCLASMAPEMVKQMKYQSYQTRRNRPKS